MYNLTMYVVVTERVHQSVTLKHTRVVHTSYNMGMFSRL